MIGLVRSILKRLFSGLRWYELTEFVILLLTTVVVTLDWRLATVGMALLGINGIIKVIKAKQFGNPALGKEARWCCAAMIAFFLVYLVSGLRSENYTYGLDVAFSKVYFLVFPLLALLSDTRYLTHLRLRMVLYILWTTLIVIFFVRVGVTIVNVMGGTPMKSFIDTDFYPIHHTYVALYLSVAVAFVATEIVRVLTGDKIKKHLKTRVLVILSVGEILLTLFAMAVNSRAGILAIILTVVATLCCLYLESRDWKLVLKAIAVVAVCACALYFFQPEGRHRLSNTVENISSDTPKDDRFNLVRYGLEVVKFDMGFKEWLIGLGEGDMKEHLYERYAAHGFRAGDWNGGVRTHNQYLDTFLGCGLIGLGALTLMLLLPLVGNNRQKRYDYFVVPSVVLPTLLFLAIEMMLVRQMGIVFIAFTYTILILWKTKTSA